MACGYNAPPLIKESHSLIKESPALIKESPALIFCLLINAGKCEALIKEWGLSWSPGH